MMVVRLIIRRVNRRNKIIKTTSSVHSNQINEVNLKESPVTNEIVNEGFNVCCSEASATNM